MKHYNVTILTLYPEVFPGPLGFSILKKAANKKIWSLNVINIRDFASGKYKKVDDTLFGGGKGLLIKPDVLSKAIDYAFNNGASKNLILLTPSGKTLKQDIVKDLSHKDGITIICGHFKGVDYRIINKYNPIEISLGDFIISGGEMASMILVDACVRLLDGAMTSLESTIGESFMEGLLECPNYTKPYNFENLKVPEVLLSGNHKEISKWRKENAILVTKQKRPDLWENYIKGENKND